MRHVRDLELSEHPAQLFLLELLSDSIGKQERAGSLGKRPRHVENLQGDQQFHQSGDRTRLGTTF